MALLCCLDEGRRGNWPTPVSSTRKWIVRGGARFLRYTYPLALVIYFFEEVAHTVNALWLDTPYWFEPYLYAADRWLFGELPALLMSDWTGLVQDEIMHAFYFSYYFIIIGGAVLAWLGPKGAVRRQPGPGLDTAMASTIFAYLLTFLWYPFFPSRGPWENPEVMAGLPAFQGYIFTPIIEFIIKNGAVSGGCFPSSHVAGSWGMVLGLAKHHRRAAWWMGLVATGLSISCVYTRYHHSVDILAGFTMAVIGTWLARRLVR